MQESLAKELSYKSELAAKVIPVAYRRQVYALEESTTKMRRNLKGLKRRFLANRVDGSGEAFDGIHSTWEAVITI